MLFVKFKIVEAWRPYKENGSRAPACLDTSLVPREGNRSEVIHILSCADITNDNDDTLLVQIYILLT